MRTLLFSLLFILPTFGFSQVGIGTTSPHSSSILELSDTSRGMLIPRITAAQKNAIINPAEGLMIYQKDAQKGYWFYDGSQWTPVAKNGGKTTIVLGGSITNAEAQVKIANEAGPNTQYVQILRCSNLTSVDLSMFNSLIDIKIWNNAVLQTVNMPALVQCLGSIDINDCPLLNTINFSSLTEIMGAFSVVSCENLANLNLNSLAWSYDRVSIAACGIQDLTLPLLIGNSGGISVVECDNLLTVSLPVLSNAGNMEIFSCSLLNTINLNSLVQVSGFFRLNSCLSLVNLNLNSLTRVFTDLSIAYCGVQNLSFPLLTESSMLFSIVECDNLLSFSLPVFNKSDLIKFQGNELLGNYFFPLLGQAKDIEIFGPVTVPVTVSFPAMYTARSLLIKDFQNLAAVSVPILQSLGYLIVFNCAQISTLNFPLLYTFYGNAESVAIYNCTDLTNVSFPSLVNMYNFDFGIYLNKLSSATVNSLLSKFVAIMPVATYSQRFYFVQNNPSAPPTGQGLVDKQILIDRGYVVQTD